MYIIIYNNLSLILIISFWLLWVFVDLIRILVFFFIIRNFVEICVFLNRLDSIFRIVNWKNFIEFLNEVKWKFLNF